MFTNTNTFYSSTVSSTYGITPSLFTNSQTFYNPTVLNVNTLAPSLFTNNQTFYKSSVGNLNTVTPNLYTNSQTFYSPTAAYSSQELLPALFTNTNSFFSPAVTYVNTLAPSLFTNTNTSYTHTVAIPTFAQQAFRWYGNGSVESSLTAVAAQDTEYALDPPAAHNRHLRIRVAATSGSAPNTTDWQLKVSHNGGAYANLPASGVVAYADNSLIDGEVTTEQLTGGSGVFSAGAVSEDGLADNIGIGSGAYTELLFSLALVGGTGGDTYDFRVYRDGAALDTYGVTPRFKLNVVPQNLSPSLFTNTNSFYNPTVLNVNTLTPSLFTNTNTFFSPTVLNVNTLAPSLFTNSQTFYTVTATATYSLTPSLFTNTNTFFSPSITTTYALTPSLFTNSSTFFSPTAENDNYVLPTLVVNNQTFFSPTVDQEPVNIRPELLVNTNVFYSPRIFDPNPRIGRALHQPLLPKGHRLRTRFGRR